MKFSSRHVLLPAILFILTFLFSACTALSPRVSERPGDIIALSEANRIVSKLKHRNIKLKTFKGVGGITFRESEKKDFTSRIAWVASAPDRIRIVLSSVSGQPVVSVASDGHWLYYFSHSSGDFYKKPATTSSMKKIFSIPIQSEDIVNILAGRIPILPHDFAEIISSKFYNYTSEGHTVSTQNRGVKARGNGYILVLRKSWGDILEKIYLDGEKKSVHKIEVFDPFGALVYRVEFKKVREVGGYRVPSRLLVSNAGGYGFRLEVDRYWPNTPVSQSMFMLTPPE